MPILDVVPAWGFRRQIELPIQPMIRGDGYYSPTSSGTRRYDEIYTFTVPSRPREEIEAVVAVLRSVRGVAPVQWSPSGVDRKDYVADNWRVQPSAPGLAKLSLELKRLAVPLPYAPGPKYPTIDLTLTWDTTFGDVARVSQRRVSQGVDRRGIFQENTFTRQFPVRTLTEGTETALNQFLLSLYGRPFRLPAIDKQIAGLDGLFNCTRWSFEGLAPDRSRFEADFQEVIRPDA